MSVEENMKTIKLISAILLLTVGQTAFAGMPYPDEEICPIGGEKFKTTSTASCSTMGRTLSMQAITSCDFVTHLAQCPSNKLPIYKKFSEQDLLEIKEFMKTETYKNNKSKSRYYLATIIEGALTSQDTLTQFFMLQNGLWHTPNQSYGDPVYMNAYHKAASIAFQSDDLEGKPFWRGAEAMVFLKEGDLEAAKKNINLMTSDDADNAKYLGKYKKALKYCLGHPQDEKLCQLTTAIRAHDDTQGKN